MTSPNILLMAGSARRDSLARRLAQACVAPLQHAGAEVNLVELGDYPAPLYHGDLERRRRACRTASSACSSNWPRAMDCWW